METKEDAESHDDCASSSIGEASRVAGEALNTVYSNVSSVPPMEAQRHRRSQSDIVIAEYERNNSFQKLKSHVKKAWRWGGRSREEGFSSSFNPEVLANQKRQWYQLHSKTTVFMPNSIFRSPLVFACDFNF